MRGGSPDCQTMNKLDARTEKGVQYSCFGPRTDSTNLLIVKAPDFCDFVRGGFWLGRIFCHFVWTCLIGARLQSDRGLQFDR